MCLFVDGTALNKLFISPRSLTLLAAMGNLRICNLIIKFLLFLANIVLWVSVES